MISSVELRGLAESGAPLAVQRDVLRQGLLERGLSHELLGLIEQETVDGVWLHETDADVRSRVGGGGSVRVPEGFVWPLSRSGLPLAFVFELALAEFAGIQELSPFPSDGTLLVFKDERGGWEGLLDSSCVVWMAEGAPTVETTEGAGHEGQPLGVKRLAGVATPLMGRGQYVDDVMRDAGEDWELASQAFDDLDYTNYGHRLLGGPLLEQGGSLADSIAEWFQEAESERDREFFTPDERRGIGWTLLMQFGNVYDADQDLDLPWSDNGAVCLAIPLADLQARDFRRVVGVFQTA